MGGKPFLGHLVFIKCVITTHCESSFYVRKFLRSNMQKKSLSFNQMIFASFSLNTDL